MKREQSVPTREKGGRNRDGREFMKRRDVTEDASVVD
jgi:hypothetical protein